MDRDGECEPPVHAGRVGAHRQVHELAQLREVHDLVVLLLELLLVKPGGQAAEDHVLAPAQLAVEADA